MIFSDESSFEVAPSRSQFVRRKRGGTLAADHTAQHKPYLQKFMVWGCFSHAGPGPLVLVEGTMRQANYFGVLQQHLIPQVK